MRTPFLRRASSLCLCLLLALALRAPARAASGTEYQAVLAASLEYLRDAVPDPVYDPIGGEWAVLALARGGLEDESWYGRYLENLFPAVDRCSGALHSRKYTEYSRVVLALSAIGQDATRLDTGSGVYDLVSPLLTKQPNGEYWASWQGHNGTIFAIIALDTQNYYNNDAGREARAGLIDALLDAQQPEGAWSISDSDDGEAGAPSIDTTAMAVQALAPYYLSRAKYSALGADHSYEDMKAAVNAALAYLKTTEGNDYGSVEAAAQVVVALAALNRDAANDALLGNVLASMLAYYHGNGAFTHMKDGSSGDNQMSQEQACYALVAYDRWKTGRTALYDMTDRGAAAAIQFDAPASVTVEQTATGSFRVTSSVPCAALVPASDGGYIRLTPEGSGNTRSFHAVHAAVWVVILGDVNGDGRFNGSDVSDAKGAFLGRFSLDAADLMAGDLDGNRQFTGADVTLLKAAFLGRESLSW